MATACHQEDLLPQTQDQTNSNTQVGVFGDEMRLCLDVVAPDPFLVGTRAVDPDGKTLQTLNLFCFDANGLFLTTATAQVKGKEGSEDQLEGTFSATVPKTTRIIHLLANQNMSLFDKDDYVYTTEDDVLSALEGSAGMMIYWARIQAPVNVSELYTAAEYPEGHTRTEAEAFVDWITIETNPTTEEHRGIAGKGNPIILLRNQAKFTIVSEGEGEDPDPADEWKGPYFEVTGFVVCNSPAFGTVAPYHPDYGFPTYACSTFIPEFSVNEVNDDVPNWLAEKRVTPPMRKEKMSDIADVSSSREQYIFETTNLSTDPVDLILRGRNRKADGTLEQERYYYRVNILDPDFEFYEILRNHHYEIHIEGNLSNGCPTFDEALMAPPTNNVWFSISDEVNSVRNNSYVLTVEKTSTIVEAAYDGGQPEKSELSLNFNIEALGSEAVDPNKIKVYWVEDDQKVSNTYNPSLVLGNKVSYNEATGKGVISLAINKLVDGSEYERGSIVVKYGHLQRKIRIVLMRTKQFTPAWVSSEVYGTVTGDTQSRSNVTVIFTIPDTCPEELFPMDVLVTTNGLDGRAATGQVLPIVREGEDGYGENFTVTAPDGETIISDLGYKYKIRVTEPGQHRVYFENILNMDVATAEFVTLEAEHFDLATKMVTYVGHKNEIELPNLLGYTINPEATEKEEVKYILVPQKRFHPVKFDIRLWDSETGTRAPYTAMSGKEEFLLYSTNLDHYTDDDARLGTREHEFSVEMFDCYFKPYDKSYWSTGGRIFGFYPREKATDGNDKNRPDEYKFLDKNDCFSIFMETNKPKSAEVVRIASNQVDSPQVKDGSQPYKGKTFRSVTFEFANYRPFRFAAQIKVGDRAPEGNYVADDATSGTQNPEVVDNIEFEYLPSEEIAISFDVTSFKAEDGTTVDPFGHAFEIFIDAPMLELDKEKNKSVGELKTGVNFEKIKVPMFEKVTNQDGSVGESIDTLKLEDLGNGRFVYRVDASGDKESQYWTDWTPSKLNKPLITPPMFGEGERKTIYFKKKSIVSQGAITISANPDHVTYHSKTFNISNTPIQGRIGYVPEGSSEPVMVPAGQFVSFARVYDGSRIGTLTVKSTNEDAPDAPTYYELRLRAEYDFNWENDPIKLMCSIDGKYYSIELADLKTLYETPNKTIVLQYDEGQNQ